MATSSPEITTLSRCLPLLRERLRIAVIYNGDKSAPGAVINETSNPRSLKSYKPVAEDIAAGLREAGFQEVSVLADDMTLAQSLRDRGIEFAWINSAGVQGYDAAGHTASMLEMLGIPYVGHSPLAAALLDNKDQFKRTIQSMGIPTAPFVTWNPVQDPGAHRSAEFLGAVFEDYSGPFVVKPVCGRASQHVHFVERPEELPDVLERVHADTSNTVLVEKFLPGREFTVAVAGPGVFRDGAFTDLGEPLVLSPAERVLCPDERIFTSMDVQPITTDRAHPLNEKSDGSLRGTVSDLGRRIFRGLYLRSLIRVDIRADADGTLNVLEVNPKPDLTRPCGKQVSLVLIGLAQAGLRYDELLVSLLLDRLYFYLAHRRQTVRHLMHLFE